MIITQKIESSCRSREARVKDNDSSSIWQESDPVGSTGIWLMESAT